MALEDKVKMLEDEVNILKSQVQNTLLEIQEQILIHYYPALRSEGAAPSRPTPPAKGNGASRKAAVAQIREVIPDSDAPLPPSVLDSGSPAVEDDLLLRSPAEHAIPAADVLSSLERVILQPEIGQDMDLTVFTSLMDWASDSVEHIGRERTKKAIEIYARGGYLDARVVDTLVQLISLCDEDDPPQKAGMRAISGTLSRLNAVLGNQGEVADAFRFMEESVG